MDTNNNSQMRQDNRGDQNKEEFVDNNANLNQNLDQNDRQNAVTSYTDEECKRLDTDPNRYAKIPEPNQSSDELDALQSGNGQRAYNDDGSMARGINNESDQAKKENDDDTEQRQFFDGL